MATRVAQRGIKRRGIGGKVEDLQEIGQAPPFLSHALGAGETAVCTYPIRQNRTTCITRLDYDWQPGA